MGRECWQRARREPTIYEPGKTGAGDDGRKHAQPQKAALLVLCTRLLFCFIWTLIWRVRWIEAQQLITETAPSEQEQDERDGNACNMGSVEHCGVKQTGS